MTTWMIEPCDPLIVRDGRPFDLQPGVLAVSLPFPFPSTTTGAVRSRVGAAKGVFDLPKGGKERSRELDALKALRVRGPLLIEEESPGQWQWLVPPPGDALLLDEDSQAQQLRCERLVPLNWRDGVFTDQHDPANAEQGESLLLAGPVCPASEKPAKKQPGFWHWSTFERWLMKPEEMDGHSFDFNGLGIAGLPQEKRVHAALERGMMVAREGALFETRGLEFTSARRTLASARRLALLLDVEASTSDALRPGLDSLGAERRLVHWRPAPPGLQKLPKCPEELIEQIVYQKACRLILLTPACFDQGYRPADILRDQGAFKPVLKAAIVQRPQIISGWDMDIGKPKPTRRLAPAGSVFFLEFPNQPEAIRQWVEQTWMQCISDQEQDRRDGFGLAVLGTWSGKPADMQIAEE